MIKEKEKEKKDEGARVGEKEEKKLNPTKTKK